MVDQGLIDYIKSNLENGFSLEEVKQSLFSQQLSKKDINDALNVVVNSQPKFKIQASQVSQKKSPIAPKPLIPKVPGVFAQPPASKNFPKVPSSPGFKKNFPVQGEPEIKPKKRIPHGVKIFLAIFFVLILVALFIFFLMNYSKPPKTLIEVSEFNIIEGISLNLVDGSEVNFTLDDENYLLVIESLDSNFVSISGSVNSEFNIGDEKFFDLDNDGENDFIIELKGISEGEADFFFKKFGGFVCPENWNCTSWGPCINDTQQRICVDLNSCGTENNKPVFEQNCSGGNTTYYGGNESYFDCGTNFSCLMNYDDNCELAQALFAYGPLDFFGVLTSSSTLYKINGIVNNTCKFYQKTISISIEFSENLTQQMMNESNMTLEEVEQAEQEANESAQSMLGSWVECYYDLGEFPYVIPYMVENPGDYDCGVQVSLGDDFYNQTCNYGGINITSTCIGGGGNFST